MSDVLSPIQVYAMLSKRIKDLVSGISNITVTNGNTLKFTLADGSVLTVTIPNQLTTQEKESLVNFIPYINKFTENDDGKLQYNSKTILTEEDIFLTQAKELIKILDAIKIDIDNKAIINGVKLDINSDGDLTLNDKKIMLKDDLPTPQAGDNNKVLKVNENLQYVLADSSATGFKKWNPDTEYIIGEYCINDKKLYECIDSHTSIDIFDETKWQLALEMGTTKNGIDVYGVTQSEYNDLLANDALDDSALYIITDVTGDDNGEGEVSTNIEFETEDIDFSNF